MGRGSTILREIQVLEEDDGAPPGCESWAREDVPKGCGNIVVKEVKEVKELNIEDGHAALVGCWQGRAPLSPRRVTLLVRKRLLSSDRYWYSSRVARA